MNLFQKYNIHISTGDNFSDKHHWSQLFQHNLIVASKDLHPLMISFGYFCFRRLYVNENNKTSGCRFFFCRNCKISFCKWKPVTYNNQKHYKCVQVHEPHHIACSQDAFVPNEYVKYLVTNIPYFSLSDFAMSEVNDGSSLVGKNVLLHFKKLCSTHNMHFHDNVNKSAIYSALRTIRKDTHKHNAKNAYKKLTTFLRMLSMKNQFPAVLQVASNVVRSGMALLIRLVRGL